MIRKRQAIRKCKKLSEKGRLSVLESEVEQLKMKLNRAEEMLNLGLVSEDQQQIASAQEKIEEINEKIIDKETDLSNLQAETGKEEPEIPGDMDKEEEPEIPGDMDKEEEPEVPGDMDKEEEPEVPGDMGKEEEPEVPGDMGKEEEPEVPGDMGNLQAETGKEEPEVPGDMGKEEEPEVPGDMGNLQEERGSLMTMEIDDMIQNMDNVLENIQAGIRK
jgi:hypothetical protein